jgi:hypothetical protein
MPSRVRVVLGIISAVVVAVVPMAIVASGAQASVLTPTATNCSAPTDSQAFLAWGDLAEYFMAPDGNFATPTAGWSLSGGAGTVAGGDGYTLRGAAPSSRSLALPSASSATPTIRFFARNSGSSLSTLLVSATVDTTLGMGLTLPVGVVAAGGAWTPTTIEPLVASLLPLLPGNLTPITLTFTPEGQGGNWQIDDVYVDPWTRGE